MNKLFNKLFKKSIKKKNLKYGSIIKGKVIDIKHNIVIIDSGLKSESYIPIEQFKDINGKINININDIVDLSIDDIASEWGETLLSREKAKKYETWLNIEKSYNKSLNIKGIINGKVKGGLTVNIDGIKAFLPGSLIDVKPIKDISEIEGKELEFKIIKLDKKKNNIVLSRKAIILNENNYEKEKLLKKIYEGIYLYGTVKNLTDYGAFIDLGGLDGLLHITDIAWKRVKHPSEILNIGQKIKLKVIKFDKEKTRVSLGLKQLTKDPWKSIEKKYPINTKIQGKITNITDYGCFIEIKEGIEGLVHISEMDWKNKNINPFKIFKIGQKTKAIILNINKEKRRISLGIKQCNPNPWINFSKKYKIGKKINGIIKSITEFGIFIKLENDIDGLIHTSDISWINKNNNFKNIYKKGEKITTIILQIDINKERISLGLKQLKEDPLNKYIKIYKNKKNIKSKITKIKNNIIFVIFKDNIEGQINIKDKKNKKYKYITKKKKINDIINTKIINIDIKKRIIYLIINKTKKKYKNNNNNKKKENILYNSMVEAFKIAKNK